MEKKRPQKGNYRAKSDTKLKLKQVISMFVYINVISHQILILARVKLLVKTEHKKLGTAAEQ